MYADNVTVSMKRCLDETNRRRKIQVAHNEEHGIQPESIRKSLKEIEFSTRVADARNGPVANKEQVDTYVTELDREEFIKILEKEMADASESMNFERAAILRDQLFELRVSPAID